MRIKMFEKSVICLIVGAVLVSLVISWWMSQREIDLDEYSDRVPNLSGIRG